MRRASVRLGAAMARPTDDNLVAAKSGPKAPALAPLQREAAALIRAVLAVPAALRAVRRLVRTSALLAQRAHDSLAPRWVANSGAVAAEAEKETEYGSPAASESAATPPAPGATKAALPAVGDRAIDNRWAIRDSSPAERPAAPTDCSRAERAAR